MHKDPRNLRDLRGSKCPPAASWVPVDPLRLLVGSSIAAAGATRVATAAVGCFLARFPEALDPKIVDSEREVLQNHCFGRVSKLVPFGVALGSLWELFPLPLDAE